VVIAFPVTRLFVQSAAALPVATARNKTLSAKIRFMDDPPLRFVCKNIIGQTLFRKPSSFGGDAIGLLFLPL
jgi:hypothetical protein